MNAQNAASVNFILYGASPMAAGKRGKSEAVICCAAGHAIRGKIRLYVHYDWIKPNNGS